MCRTEKIMLEIEYELDRQQCPLNLSSIIEDRFEDLVKNDVERKLFLRFEDPITNEIETLPHSVLSCWIHGLTNEFYKWARKLLPFMAQNQPQTVKIHCKRDDYFGWKVIETSTYLIVLRSKKEEWANNVIKQHLIGLLLNNA